MASATQKTKAKETNEESETKETSLRDALPISPRLEKSLSQTWWF